MMSNNYKQIRNEENYSSISLTIGFLTTNLQVWRNISYKPRYCTNTSPKKDYDFILPFQKQENKMKTGHHYNNMTNQTNNNKKPEQNKHKIFLYSITEYKKAYQNRGVK